MRCARWVPAAVLATLVAACSSAVPANRSMAAGAEQATTPTPQETTAAAITPDPRVGAVFLGGQTLHVCSGSVLDTPGGDLILTAAHCLVAGQDGFFVPGFAEQSAAENFWRIDSVYLDPRWVANQDPLADFAIARVSRDGSGPIQQRVGSGFTLGTTPQPGTDITVHGYAFGFGGDQLGCQARTTMKGQYPQLPCAGLVDGTSGSPWVSGTTVTGVVGGLEGGGCEENVSYSPPFDAAVGRVLVRAEQGDAGDDTPTETMDYEC
jgi:hypothetical protein